MEALSSAARAAAHTAASSACGLAKAMLNRRVSLNRATSCGTRAAALRREDWVTSRRSAPSRVTRPLWGSSRRRARRTMGVLPAPDGPTRAVVLPRGATKLTSSRPTERAVCWKPTCSNTSSAPPPATGGGAELVFEHVGFQHTARSVGLDDVSFVAPRGSTTALVGPSGAGKTTIVRLALRLLDPQSGRVTLDGADLRDVTQSSLRRAAALVPQDVALFNDTLRFNIAFANPQADDAAVWAAARAAELSAFIEGLPYQMATKVGERGLKLSGGE